MCRDDFDGSGSSGRDLVLSGEAEDGGFLCAHLGADQHDYDSRRAFSASCGTQSLYQCHGNAFGGGGGVLHGIRYILYEHTGIGADAPEPGADHAGDLALAGAGDAGDKCGRTNFRGGGAVE